MHRDIKPDNILVNS
jgi:serine/threonine protein kinase